MFDNGLSFVPFLQQLLMDEVLAACRFHPYYKLLLDDSIIKNCLEHVKIIVHVFLFTVSNLIAAVESPDLKLKD